MQKEVENVGREVLSNIIDKETTSMEVVSSALLNVKAVRMECTNQNSIECSRVSFQKWRLCCCLS
jgi:hypothetical protein